MFDTTAQLKDFLVSLLPAGGVAALVATVIGYLMKSKVDAVIKASVDSRLENLKAELAAENEHIKSLLKLRFELLPGLVGAIYQSRNVARDLAEDLTFQPDLRSRLGDLGLLVTERLYEVRALLPREVFDKLHAYKTNLQGFIFDYDTATQTIGNPVRPEIIKSLRGHYSKIDELYDSIVKDIQAILRVDKQSL
jgi:hypothetical protein